MQKLNAILANSVATGVKTGNGKPTTQMISRQRKNFDSDHCSVPHVRRFWATYGIALMFCFMISRFGTNNHDQRNSTSQAQNGIGISY
jgi:hypothetical protein